MATDPAGLRGDAPLLDAWVRFHEDPPTPFTIPGHKQRHDLVGDVVAGDVPLYAGLDTMGLAHGVLDDAERRAATLWGADRARLSVGGSTHGNQALALMVGRPGDEVVVTRTLHRSLLLGLVLADLRPRWVRPRVDPATGLPTGVHADDLAEALRGGSPVAAFVGEPSYVGTIGDVGALAATAHARGVPLLVDAAWGAHLGFHPAYPPHALQAGADALVTSAHKMLPAVSQAAFVLVRTERIDPDRVDPAVDTTATTSPNGQILASADAARALLARDGAALLGRLAEGVADLRARLSAVEGLTLLGGPGVDPSRVVLVLGGTGADGRRIEADLIAQGLPVEMADRDTLVALVTLADDASTLDHLATALEVAVERHRGSPREPVTSGVWSVDPVQGMSPREAFFARRRRVPFSQARGLVSAELVAPYPPGVPILAPGEVVTEAVQDALTQALASGTRIAYAADPSLATLDVVA